MRKSFPVELEKARTEIPELGMYKAPGSSYGAFVIRGPRNVLLRIISSGGEKWDKVSQGWEHVSVSTKHRTPFWEEMVFVKNLFWKPEECVVQFHPPESVYVNNHPFVLHLWRNNKFEIPLPPSIMVGVKDAGTIKNREEASAVLKKYKDRECEQS